MRSACPVASRLYAKTVGWTRFPDLAHQLTIISGHSNLPASCPVCEHSPLSAEDCNPHKSLRTTIKVFLRTAEKKRADAKAKELKEPETEPETPAEPTPAPESAAEQQPAGEAAPTQDAVEEETVKPTEETPLPEEGSQKQDQGDHVRFDGVREASFTNDSRLRTTSLMAKPKLREMTKTHEATATQPLL